jgi:hypothetical protein
MTGSFAQPNVPGDDGLEHLIFEVGFDFMGDLVGEVVPRSPILD